MLLNKDHAFKDEEIQFPIDYNIKIIMDATISDEENAKVLKDVFNKLEIPNKNWKNRLSKNGSYISFTVELHLKDKKQFNQLYDELKKNKSIKWAV